MNKTPSPKN